MALLLYFIFFANIYDTEIFTRRKFEEALRFHVLVKMEKHLYFNPTCPPAPQPNSPPPFPFLNNNNSLGLGAGRGGRGGKAPIVCPKGSPTMDRE
jgi:hypothetical protein